MPDDTYLKLKNAELSAMCQERNLRHTGTKADLIARLRTYDEQQKAPTITHPEDVIDWDEEDEPAPAPPATAAATTTAVPAANEEATVEPAQPAAAAVTTNGTATSNPAETAAGATTEAPAASFAAGLQATLVDEELEKRKRRVERFRNPNDEESMRKADEEIKMLERQARFKDASIATKMDSALPERQKRKRGEEDGEDGGFKRRGNRRFNRGRRGGRVQKK